VLKNSCLPFSEKVGIFFQKGTDLFLERYRPLEKGLFITHLHHPTHIFIKILSNTFGDKRTSYIFATLFRGKAKKETKTRGV
jgi:hypothetical protein